MKPPSLVDVEPISKPCMYDGIKYLIYNLYNCHFVQNRWSYPLCLVYLRYVSYFFIQGLTMWLHSFFSTSPMISIFPFWTDHSSLLVEHQLGLHDYTAFWEWGQASFLDASDIAFRDAPPSYGASVRGSGRGCSIKTLQLKWGQVVWCWKYWCCDETFNIESWPERLIFKGVLV